MTLLRRLTTCWSWIAGIARGPGRHFPGRKSQIPQQEIADFQTKVAHLVDVKRHLVDVKFQCSAAALRNNLFYTVEITVLGKSWIWVASLVDV